MKQIIEAELEKFKDFYWETEDYAGRKLRIDEYNNFLRESLTRAMLAVVERFEKCPYDMPNHVAISVEFYRHFCDQIKKELSE